MATKGTRHRNADADSTTAVRARVAELEQQLTQLRQVVHGYQALFDYHLDPIFSLDQDGCFVMVNPAAERLAGYSQAELLGMNFARLCAPDQLEKTQHNFLQELNGVSEDLETAFITKDGRRVEVFITGGPIVVEGKIVGAYGVVRDITAQKQAEDQLRQSEERFRQLLENSADAVSLLDAAGRTVWTTASATRLLGYATAELLDRPIYDFVHPEDHAQVTALHAALLAQPAQGGGCTVRCRHRDGSWRWIEGHATNCLAMPGVQGIVMNFRDVTERKRAEAALWFSERQWQTTFDAMNDAVCVVSLDEKILSANRAMSALTGKSPLELIGQHCCELLQDNAEPVEPGPVARLRDSRRRESRVKRWRGRWLEMTADPLGSDSGDLVGAVYSVADITERKQAEELLKKNQRLLAETEAIGKVGGWEFNAETGKLIWTNEVYRIHELDLSLEPTLEQAINFYTPTSRPIIQTAVQRAVELGEPFDVELEIITARGNLRGVHAIGKVDRDQRRVYGFFQDITARKQAEAVLRRSQEELEALVQERTVELGESEERFRQLATNIREVFYLEDAQMSRVLYVSPAYEEIWRRPCASVYADSHAWWEAVHPGDRTRLEHIVEAHRLGQPYDVEYRIIRPDHAVRWIHDRGFPIADATGTVYRFAGICEDITDRKRLEREILNISEREQRRIGQELHDGVCQLLTGIGFAGELLTHKLAEQALPEAADAAKVQALLAEAAAQVRNVARGLNPVELEADGLRVALEVLAGNIARLFPVECALICPQPVPLHDQVAALHLYRIAQQAVNHSLNHTAPAHIWIGLAATQAGVTLTIEDDGTGVPPEPRGPAGFGLRSLAYRARILGGSLDVQRGANGGTVVTCSCPNPIRPATDTAAAGGGGQFNR